MDDWAQLRAEIDRIVAESAEPIDSATAAQARSFLERIRDVCAVPRGLGSNKYERSINLSWNPRTPAEVEIEIHGDRFLVFRFPQRQVYVKQFDHVLGEPFSPDLIAELPKR